MIISLINNRKKALRFKRIEERNIKILFKEIKNEK